MSWLHRIFHRTDFPDFILQYQACQFRLAGNTPLHELSFVVLDAETTGLGKSDKIITLGGVSVKNFEINITQVLDQRYDLAEGGSSSEIHEELAASSDRDRQDLMKEALAFIGGKIIVGHHIGFDVSKINQLISGAYPGFALRNTLLDTFYLMMRLDRPRYERMVGGRNALQLDEVCKELGIQIENRHTALGDAYVTAQVFLFILSRLQDRGVHTLADLVR